MYVCMYFSGLSQPAVSGASDLVFTVRANLKRAVRLLIYPPKTDDDDDDRDLGGG